MNLDDRLRSAHKRRLDDTTALVAGTTFSEPTTSPLRRAAPVLVVAAAALVALVGAFVIFEGPAPITVESIDEANGGVSDPIENVADVLADSEDADSTDAATPDPEGEPTAVERDDEPVAPGEPDELPQPEELADDAAIDPAVSTPEADQSAGAEPATEASATADPAETQAVPATVPPGEAAKALAEPQVADGIASIKCPSGTRAQLENSTLAYVTESQGWGRLDDLVDEQDAEFEFEAWEPGFPDPVTVEVELGELVSAVDLRVSQDPFTPVSGNIDIEVFRGDEIIESFTIALDGVDGWRDHTFAAATLLDRFRITRSVETANIMEILVCVE